MHSELNSHKALTINPNCMKCYMIDDLFTQESNIQMLYSCKRWVRKRACVPKTSNDM